MAVIALTSASGSPGVTTTALSLALAWPRPVLLVEADPTGGAGILAGYFRGGVEYETGLLDLALSAYDVADELPRVARAIKDTQVSYVAGTRTHAQAAALRDRWSDLAIALADLEETGQDAIVDAGRLGLVGSPAPLLAAADLSLLLVRSDLPALAAARSWAETIRDPVDGWAHPAVLLVGEGMPYVSGEVSRVLGLRVLAELPDDPISAAVHHRGTVPPRHFATGTYTRAIRATAAVIQSDISHARLALSREVVR